MNNLKDAEQRETVEKKSLANKLGNLYIVATPIGNLGDMVPRAITVLQQANWVAVEDTRHSGRLLAHFDIDTPMLAYHDHSNDHQLQRILNLLTGGKTVALITDAGTPLISDPGYKLVRHARQLGITVTPIPGCCAAIAALSAAGIPSDRFSFEGFLAAKEAARRKTLQGLAREPRTLVFYEAPHRILATLTAMAECLGADREAVVAREVTKAHETFLSGTMAELVAQVAADSNQQRGEIVIIVHGAQVKALTDDEQEQQRVLCLLMAELPSKQAAALTAKITGGNKKQLYNLAVSLKNS